MQTVFKPAGNPLADTPSVSIYYDELEAMHLCDGRGMTQEEAGTCMAVSRGTVQRLLSEGRRKVASALVDKRAISITSRRSVV